MLLDCDQLEGRLRDLCRGYDDAGRPVLTVEKRAAYRELFEKQLARKQPPAPPCRHLGPDSGETIGCQSCRGQVRLKLFACAVHRHCTIGKKVADTACCDTCVDRT